VVAVCAAICGCSPARRASCASSIAVARRGETAEPDRRTGIPALPSSAPPALPSLSRDPFFAGAEPLAEKLGALTFPTRRDDGALMLEPARFEDVEDSLRDEFRAAGRRDVSSLFVVGIETPFGLPPMKAAELLQDATVERDGLSAEEGVEVSRRRTGSMDESVIRVAMLRMGEWPFLYDFRWQFRVAREAKSDGSVLVRYELVDDAPREHMSFFRGVATLVPAGKGSTLREVLAIASPLSPPFFLKARVRDTVLGILGRRWMRIATRSLIPR
jgi:hypothetical protein